MSQSPALSLVEAGANVAAGYVIAVAVQMAVFPMFGLDATFEENLAIGAVFTLASLCRGFALRRLFARLERRPGDATSSCSLHPPGRSTTFAATSRRSAPGRPE